jgi:hypothetical protein
MSLLCFGRCAAYGAAVERRQDEPVHAAGLPGGLPVTGAAVHVVWRLAVTEDRPADVPPGRPAANPEDRPRDRPAVQDAGSPVEAMLRDELADLRKRLTWAQEALDREQIASAELRRLLASAQFALQASRPTEQAATPAPTPAPEPLPVQPLPTPTRPPRRQKPSRWWRPGQR